MAGGGDGWEAAITSFKIIYLYLVLLLLIKKKDEINTKVGKDGLGIKLSSTLKYPYHPEKRDTWQKFLF